MKKDYTQLFSSVALTVIGILLYNDYKKSKKIKDLELALNSSNNISETIKKQLIDLVESHPHVDADVRNELQQIAFLIGIQQETKAILSLAKIIETFLKKLFKNNAEFKEFMKTKKRRATFADHLDFAKETKILHDEDYYLIKVLKLIRNEEAHEINVIKDKSKLIGCFISGLGIAINLYNTIKVMMVDESNHEKGLKM